MRLYTVLDRSKAEMSTTICVLEYIVYEKSFSCSFVYDIWNGGMSETLVTC